MAGSPKKKDAVFYQGQITGARFFIHTILPVAQAKMAVIQTADTSALDMADAAFGA
ncbi:MAG: acyl-CoA dehydrogenase C-terminal domain-containing protein [Desulfotignum sp.]